MPELSTEQETAVRHGLSDPQDVTYAVTPEGLSLVTPIGIIIQASINYSGVRTEPEGLGWRRWCDPEHPALNTLAGYCEILQRTQYAYDPQVQLSPLHVGAMAPTWCTPLKWFFRRETAGGGHGSTGYASKEQAELELARAIWQHVLFWETKIAYRDNGDMTIVPKWRRGRDKPGQVIRCDGRHYVIGPEPSSRADRGMLGFAGAKFTFRMLATGEILVSHNVWHQGRIPAEYRAVLPDNAEKG